MQSAYWAPLHLSNHARGVIQVNLEGMVTGYDATAEQLLRKPRDQVLFNNFWDSFSDEFFGFSMKQALAEKQISANKKPLAAGLNFTEVEALFICQEENPPTPLPVASGILVLIRTMSELERCKAIAARNEHLKELDKMTAMVAHEIRNPLGGIKGFASLLQRDLKDQPDLCKLATTIIEETESLSRLINHILSYTASLQLNLKPQNLVSLLQELLAHLKADETIDPNITFQLQTTTETIAFIDPDSFKSALLNLTANAIQAMPKGGTIWIKLYETAKEAIIEISDTGVGIPKENIPKIFSPFFTTRPKGHGFGLMEVHKIVHEHHGEIEFFSTPGIGTTFIICLPKVLSHTDDATCLNSSCLRSDHVYR